MHQTGALVSVEVVDLYATGHRDTFDHQGASARVART